VFTSPKDAVLVAITKLKFVEEVIGDWEDVLQAVTNEENVANNFCNFTLIPCEQDDED